MRTSPSARRSSTTSSSAHTGPRPCSGCDWPCAASIATSSSALTYPRPKRTANRSSWASGSGYVPALSIGFWVATTKKGSGRTRRVPSAVTWPSAIASSSADCVRGLARLISSASRMLQNTGPSWKWKAWSRGSKVDTPMMSEGSRSAVNWTRLKLAVTERASAFASVVLPVPGMSSSSTWPPEAKAASSQRSGVGWPRITRARLACSAASCCVARLTWTPLDGIDPGEARRLDGVAGPDHPRADRDEVQAEHHAELAAHPVGAQGSQRLGPANLARGLVGGGDLAPAARLGGAQHRAADFQLAPAVLGVGRRARHHDVGAETVHGQRRMPLGREALVQVLQRRVVHYQIGVAVREAHQTLALARVLRVGGAARRVRHVHQPARLAEVVREEPVGLARGGNGV